MVIRRSTKPFVVFDLDDTLFHEIDYLKSAYREIADALVPDGSVALQAEMFRRYRLRENVFSWLVAEHANSPDAPTFDGLRNTYRSHRPTLALRPDADRFIRRLRARAVPMGLITDGRSVTQRNKLQALGLQELLCEVVISEEFGSEKPDPRNYLHFEHKYPGASFTFIGDNTTKDFVVPVSLGWTTICMADDGQNIHPQSPDTLPAPVIVVNSFDEIELE